MYVTYQTRIDNSKLQNSKQDNKFPTLLRELCAHQEERSVSPFVTLRRTLGAYSNTLTKVNIRRRPESVDMKTAINPILPNWRKNFFFLNLYKTSFCPRLRLHIFRNVSRPVSCHGTCLVTFPCVMLRGMQFKTKFSCVFGLANGRLVIIASLVATE